MTADFRTALALPLYVGAARADATPEQLAALADTVIPLLNVYVETGDASAVRSAVRAVMGDHWHPSGEWAAYIDRLGARL